MKKYAAAVNYYPNCRSCDSGYYSRIIFFDNIRQVLSWALKNKDEEALMEIYSCKTGKGVFSLGYELGFHSCAGVIFKHKGFHIRTQDNGKGELVWVRQ